MNNVIRQVCILLLLSPLSFMKAMESELVNAVQAPLKSLALCIQDEYNEDFKKAVECRNLGAAQEALKRGAQIDACNPLVQFFKSFSAGPKPVEMNKHDHAMVEWLAQNGAPVNPEEGNALLNPLVYALQKCTLGCCVEALLKAGAKPTIDTVDFRAEPFVQQPLCAALAAGNKAFVELLCNYGARVNCKAARGRTPLHCVLDAKRLTVEQKKSLIAFLIAQKADVSAFDDQGLSPLHEAIQRGDTVAVLSLLEQGASANAPTLLNELPLHLALEKYAEALKVVEQQKMHRYLRIIQLLVHYKADVHEYSMSGATALQFAVSIGSAPLLKILLAGVGDGGLSQTHQGQLVHLVLEAHFKSKVRVALIHELAQAGVGFNAMDALGFSPLTKAINKVDLACVEVLLSHGAEPSAVDGVKRVPLELAQRKVVTSKNQNAVIVVERLQEYLDGSKKAQFKK